MVTNATTNPTIMRTLASEQETAAYGRLLELLSHSPLPPKETLFNLGLFLNRASFGSNSLYA